MTPAPTWMLVGAAVAAALASCASACGAWAMVHVTRRRAEYDARRDAREAIRAIRRVPPSGR